MTNYTAPLAAAVGCAVCNGIAAVLQKISADKEHNVSTLDAGLLVRLFKDAPYIVGIGLDILGWLLTLYAVQYLPLFLVEAVIAANIVVVAITDRFIRHRALGRPASAAILVIVLGLVLLALATSPERAAPISGLLRWLIILLPAAIGLVGYVFARSKSHIATLTLAIFSGIAFGSTSLIGRIFTVSHPLWHTIYSPLVLALIASGILGILLFAIALQRMQVTVVNAVMTASQTLVPGIIGVAFLGDDARNGLWYLVIVGTILALGGVGFLAIAPTMPSGKRK